MGRQPDDDNQPRSTDAECGELLRMLGFAKSDGDDRWWRRG